MKNLIPDSTNQATFIYKAPFRKAHGFKERIRGRKYAKNEPFCKPLNINGLQNLASILSLFSLAKDYLLGLKTVSFAR